MWTQRDFVLRSIEVWCNHSLFTFYPNTSFSSAYFFFMSNYFVCNKNTTFFESHPSRSWGDSHTSWHSHFYIFFILLRVFITKENERKIYSLIYFTHEREKILTTFLDRTVKNFANNWSISSAIPPWIESFPSLGAVGKHWKMEKLEGNSLKFPRFRSFRNIFMLQDAVEGQMGLLLQKQNWQTFSCYQKKNTALYAPKISSKLHHVML